MMKSGKRRLVEGGEWWVEGGGWRVERGCASQFARSSSPSLPIFSFFIIGPPPFTLHSPPSTPILHSQLYMLAALGHRFRGGFEDAHHAPAGMDVAQGLLGIVNAVDEMLGQGGQGLGTLDLRRPHVAGAIADSLL